MAGNKKRKSYTVEEKLAIIDRVKKGTSKAHLKRELGIPESTIRGWMQEEERLLSFLDNVDKTSALLRKKTRMGKQSDLDKCLFVWFVQKRSEGLPISGPSLKVQAQKFHRDLQIKDEFSASDGWLWRWQKRHGVGEITTSGESRSSDHGSAGEFPKLLKNIISENNYSEELIFNCDETALYYRMLPTKTLDLKQAPTKAGFKLSKDRITLLLCVNRTGKCKIPPLCIGKSKNPRCFKSTDMSKLPAKYSSSSNAWMTANLFHEWFHHDFVPHFRSFAKKKNLEAKGLLLLDNCPAHPPAESLTSDDGKIKALFLPKNTTSLIQPLDQGIIHAFKVNYRRELLLSLLAEEIDLSQFLKSLNLKDTIYRIGLAWDSITKSTIYNCWKNILKDELTELNELAEDCQMVEDGSDVTTLSNILGEPELTADTLKKWTEIDSNEKPYDVLTDQDIINSVVPMEQPIDEQDSEDETRDSITPAPTDAEALAAVNVLLTWMEGHKGHIDPIKLLQVSAIKPIIMKAKERSLKQLKITDLFMKR